MIYLQLFYEFFKVGLFSIGGGLATLPFLYDLSYRTGWFTTSDLANMIAVSESTPGPIGVNMATYAGYQSGGLFGGIIATLGLITPSVIVILIIARFLQKFSEAKIVKDVFYGLRPASAGLIAAAAIQVFKVSVLTLDSFMKTHALTDLFNWKALILFAVLMILTNIKKLKEVHPIFFLLGSGVIGILLSL